MGAKQDLYDYISSGGIRKYTTEELRTAGNISEWARVLRQLRQDEIIDYEHHDGLYILKRIGEYSTESPRQGLSQKLKYEIQNRDGHRCQSCGKGVEDKVKLHVDHKIPLDWGGSNLPENLWILCSTCNEGKKNFFKDDFDPEIMKLVTAQSSGYQKLKVLFENSPGIKFTPSILQGISGIRDWTRTIRDIRTKHNYNLEWFPPDDENQSGYYSYII